MKLVWFPTWKCNNYNPESRCPYCPYGWDEETDSLKYLGKVSCREGSIKPETVKAFFENNMETIGGTVEITGGEPLMYKDLSTVLDSNIGWAITSNTTIVPAIVKLIDSGALKRCFSWTASYHPFSEREKEFSAAIFLLADHNINTHVTVVVSEETLPILREITSFLGTLPISGISWHLDAHKDISNGLREAAEKIIGRVNWIAGEPKVNMNCLKNSNLLALSPGGELFNCVSHCYSDKDPITVIDGSYNLSELKPIIENCPDECFACCDWIKHV